MIMENVKFPTYGASLMGFRNCFGYVGLLEP